MDLYTLLLVGHLIGTVLGVGGATMIEVHLNKALSDNTMSSDERGMLGLNFTVLRIGLALCVLTGVGFIAFYFANGHMSRLENPVFWAKMFMIVVVLVNAVLLQMHKISLYWGSALSFFSWWGIMILGFFLTNSVRFGFIEIAVAYVAFVVGGAYVLHKIREFTKVIPTNHGNA